VSTDCNSTEFDESQEAVEKWLKEEYSFWQEEGYTEEEADHIYIEA